MNKKIYINGRFLTQELTGVQRFAYEISKNLSSFNKKNLVLLIPPIDTKSLSYSYNFQIKKIGKNKGHLWEQIDLLLFLKNNKNPLLLNLTNSGPLLYKNQISTIHDISFYFNKEWYSFLYRNLYKIITPILIKNSLKILTVSEFSKNTIINHFTINSDKIIVINNAVDIDLNKTYDLDMNDDFILFVGASSKRKNLINVLKAFNKIENNNIKLKIVGLGKVYKIKDALFKNEKIEILNNIDDDILYSLYKKAKMLVFPSFYEGFGIPPLEAMNLSCPVIASDIPVFREIYQNSVLYVDPNNINEIKSSILELLNNDNLRSRLINLGLIQCKKYSWIKSAKKLLDNIN